MAAVLAEDFDYFVKPELAYNEVRIDVLRNIIMSDYCPDDILLSFENYRQRLIGCPVYRFDVDIRGKWKASYQKNIGIKSSLYVWRTKKKRFECNAALFYYCGSIDRQEHPKVAKLIERKAGRSILSPEKPSHIKIDIFDEIAADESSAYASISEDVEKIANGYAERRAGSWRSSDLKVRYQTWHSSDIVCVPVYHIDFLYEEKSYNVLHSGDRKTDITFDKLPVDKRRREIVDYGYFPMMLSLISLCTIGLSKNPNFTAIIFPFLFWLFALDRKKTIIEHHRNVRRKQLEMLIDGFDVSHREVQHRNVRPLVRSSTWYNSTVIPALCALAVISTLGHIYYFHTQPVETTSASRFQNSQTLKAKTPSIPDDRNVLTPRPRWNPRAFRSSSEQTPNQQYSAAQVHRAP